MKVIFIILTVLLLCAAVFLLNMFGAVNIPLLPNPNAMTFEVTVPQNTPERDRIYLTVNRGEMVDVEMRPIGRNKYQGYLTSKDLNLDPGEDPTSNEIIYYYSRNGLDAITGEHLVPDISNNHWENHGRRTFFRKGKKIEDIVARWRWLSEVGEVKETLDIVPSGNWQTRINGRDFWSGQAIQDLYFNEFADFSDSTAKHMREKGYNRVVLDPPLQWISQVPPKIGNDIKNAPNYPNDKTFADHLKAFKRQGLSVMVGPQLCCTEIETRGRRSNWWDAWYSETEKFLVSQAKLSQEAGADAFYFAIGSEIFNEGAPDPHERWVKIWRNVKEVFKGEVGQMVWHFQLNKSDPVGIIPSADSITWADELDFFVLQMDNELSGAANPTDNELLNGAGKNLDSALPLFEKFNKPVFVKTAYASVERSWLGGEFYGIVDMMNAPWFGSDEWKKNPWDEFSGIDQARVINAYFEAIAKRPWIVGFSNFGYWHWDMSKAPDMSVRGKVTEDLWERWNGIVAK